MLKQQNFYYLKQGYLLKKNLTKYILQIQKMEKIEQIIVIKYDDVDNDEKQGYECDREIIEKFKEINNKTLYKFSYWGNILLQFAIDYFYEEDEIFQKVLKEKNMLHMKRYCIKLYFRNRKVAVIDGNIND